MSNIFDLFNLVDANQEEQEAKEQAEREAKEAEMKKLAEEKAALMKAKADNSEIDTDAKNTTKTKKSTDSKKRSEAEEFKPTEETIIRYLGESIPVTQYFTSEELAEGLLVQKTDGETERKELTGELLRKRMEKDYPELVASHTDMVFITKKTGTYIIPMSKAKKKGANTLLEAVSEDTVSARIPFFILVEFIGLANHYAKQGLEVHGDVYFNHDNNEFFLDVPPQSVHKLWCQVEEDNFECLDRIDFNNTKVAEIHSHHNMRPIPSAQDNRSERQKRMIYVIVGSTYKFFPDITARTFNGVDWDTLCIEDVFERPAVPMFDETFVHVEKEDEVYA